MANSVEKACDACGKPVPVGGGVNVRGRGRVGGWRTLHPACNTREWDRTVAAFRRLCVKKAPRTKARGARV